MDPGSVGSIRSDECQNTWAYYIQILENQITYLKASQTFSLLTKEHPYQHGSKEEDGGVKRLGD